MLRLLRRGARPAPLPYTARAWQAVATVSLRAASDHGCLLRSLAIVIACRLGGYTLTGSP
ncbi:lasso peptide biosynthesis protein [Amycolatopsis sp. FDAARGOS 1241]|uniref:lasso peptide biosynthesis protein n=1 Tax=Amycolatopsis sp. FDAARGOS 1241 TaxID=2778070 RepID=UPI0019507A8E|nr:lasso peptide biosynthesis protein [Amycolatopsis sp. FDAARGOS 1241]